jgi:hypothetical protein
MLSRTCRCPRIFLRCNSLRSIENSLASEREGLQRLNGWMNRNQCSFYNDEKAKSAWFSSKERCVTLCRRIHARTSLRIPWPNPRDLEELGNCEPRASGKVPKQHCIAMLNRKNALVEKRSHHAARECHGCRLRHLLINLRVKARRSRQVALTNSTKKCKSSLFQCVIVSQRLIEWQGANTLFQNRIDIWIRKLKRRTCSYSH